VHATSPLGSLPPTPRRCCPWWVLCYSPWELAAKTRPPRCISWLHHACCCWIRIE
jgi:hypothetical protein